jgi:hypothetical protein
MPGHKPNVAFLQCCDCKSRVMADWRAKIATEHVAAAAARIGQAVVET